jgi:hypothetical protein
VANTLERGMAGVVAAQQAQIGHKFIVHRRDSWAVAANVPPCAQECNGSLFTSA